WRYCQSRGRPMRISERENKENEGWKKVIQGLRRFLLRREVEKCLAFWDPALVSHPFLSLTGRSLKAPKKVK
ncbi:hypothetical protein NDU88_000058, partial [Pleurodeles waltl]